MNFCCFLKLATQSFVLSLMATIFPALGFSQTEAQLKQALEIPPKQSDVDYDQPTDEELKNLKLEITKDPAGFVVSDTTGRILRQFLDTNKDNQLDRWSYYKNGMEVYRDVDADYDKKTDQYRWVGPGGTRWGDDPDQDGKIDAWKYISAEEVAFEVFQSIKDGDEGRFKRLLITPEEFKSLDLGKPIASEIQDRWRIAQTKFLEFCKTQKEITPATEWVHSSNGLPAMVPEGAHDNRRDVVVYDHASAVFKSSDYGQLAIGTIVQIGPGVWRIFELPEVAVDGKAIGNGGAFFPMPGLGDLSDGGIADVDPADKKLAELYKELDEIEDKLKSSEKPVEIAKLEGTKAEMLEQFYWLTKQDERKQNWLENIADSVASSYQSERYPEGIKFLNGFATRLKQKNVSAGLDYIAWRSLFAKYGLATDIGDSKAREEAHEHLIEDLKEFQAEYKTSEIAADALSQLGIHYEINNETKEAIKWYQDTLKRFPGTKFGKRAEGSLYRLEGVGKPIDFVGTDLRGRKFNLQDPKLRGKIVVLHFWETWCTDGLDEIQKLAEKYKDDAIFVGCNIDTDTDALTAYAKSNPDYFAWTQLHSPGGMENSPLAHQLGVPSEPLVLVFDAAGNLAEADVAFSDLEREIERQRRKMK